MKCATRRLASWAAILLSSAMTYAGSDPAHSTGSTSSRPRTDAEALAQRGKHSHPAQPTAGAAEAHPEKPQTAEAKAKTADHDGPAQPSAAEVVSMLLKGNTLFATHHDASYFAPFAKSQQPKVTLLTCSDSRVHTHLFGGNPDNYFFVVRDIGNQMATAQGSIDYGIQHLKTPVLLIMGHTGCGAVRAAMGDFQNEDADIVRELDPLTPAIDPHATGEFDARWAHNIESNVDFQVRQALATYREQVQSGKLTVLGAIYDFQNVYRKGPGTMVIVNVNGETDPEQVRDDLVFKKSGIKSTEAHVGRLAPTESPTSLARPDHPSH